MTLPFIHGDTKRKELSLLLETWRDLLMFNQWWTGSENKRLYMQNALKKRKGGISVDDAEVLAWFKTTKEAKEFFTTYARAFGCKFDGTVLHEPVTPLTGGNGPETKRAKPDDADPVKGESMGEPASGARECQIITIAKNQPITTLGDVAAYFSDLDPGPRIVVLFKSIAAKNEDFVVVGDKLVNVPLLAQSSKRDLLLRIKAKIKDGHSPVNVGDKLFLRPGEQKDVVLNLFVLGSNEKEIDGADAVNLLKHIFSHENTVTWQDDYLCYEVQIGETDEN